MKLNEKVIEYCLYATYSIDFWTRFSKKLRSATVEEKINYSQNYVLENQFLIRRLKDPGFYEYVNQCLLNDKKAIELTKKYIQKTFYDSVDNINDSIFIMFPEDNKMDSTTIDNIQPLHDKKSIESMIEGMDKELTRSYITVAKNIKEYLTARYENAIAQKDEDEIRALSWLLKENQTHMLFMHNVFDNPGLYFDTENTENWSFSQNRYLMENIRFLDIYSTINGIGMPEHEKLGRYTGIDLSIVNNFFELICKLEGKEVDLKNLIWYNKFIMDSISVASSIWFFSQSEEEKIKILNQEYKFEAFENSIDDLFGNNDIYAISQATYLYKNHFYDMAGKIYQYILKKTVDEELKYVCYDGLGCICREEERFSDAIDYFNEALKLSRSLTKSREYREAVCLKNVGEMYLRLHKIRDADICFSKARRATGLTNEKKAGIFVNIASAYRRSYRFENEYKTLFEIINILGLKPENAHLVADNIKPHMVRLMEIDMIKEQNKKAFTDELKRQEEFKRYTANMQTGSLLFRSFQFEDGRTYFERAYKIKNSPDILVTIISSYLLQHDDENAILRINEIIDRFKDQPEGYLYKAIYYIRKDKISLTVDFLEHYIVLTIKDKTELKKGIEILVKELVLKKDWTLMKNVFNSMDDRTFNLCKFVGILGYVGEALLENGFFEEAIEYFNLGLKKYPISENMFNSHVCNGYVWYIKHQYKNAIEEYENAIKIKSKDPRTLVYLSMAYAGDLDFTNAKKYIDQAIQYVTDKKEKSEYESMRKTYEVSISDKINFNSISNKEVRIVLESAERFVLELYNKLGYNKGDIDFSVALIYYGKAMEKMLHGHITEPMLLMIKSKYGNDIPDWILYGDRVKNIRKLPPVFKGVLGEKQRSISVGQWAYIGYDLENFFSNPIVRDINEFISTGYHGQLPVISEACFNIYESRNESTHSHIKTREDVMSVRSDIIRSINSVIDCVYAEKT